MFTISKTNPNKDKYRAIAIVEGGKHNGYKVYLTDDPKLGDFEEIEDVKGGSLRPLPNLNSREICYVAGPSGSGKSTWASKYIDAYRRIKPKADFFMFSRVNEDSAIDRLKPIRIPIDEELINDPVDILEDMEDHDIVLFDDTDTILNNDLRKEVSKIKNDIMETGRHRNITCVITSHLINGNDKKDCRTILNECHNLTVFPRCGNAYQIYYVLKNYWGMNKAGFDKIMRLPSRWVTISKIAPQYVLHEKGVYLL